MPSITLHEWSDLHRAARNRGGRLYVEYGSDNTPGRVFRVTKASVVVQLDGDDRPRPLHPADVRLARR